jgi:AGZA family xanthine/uracil permease-like MFS transporter
LAVNAGIIAQTGGTCVDSDNPRCPNGPGSLGDTDCQDCLQTLQRQLIAATAAACIISHFVMGVAANMPLAICPGMGINAYFAFTVVGFMGTGRVPYRQALAAVFIEGLVFIVITAVGFRNWIIDRLPKSIMFATAGGIGLFLTFLGLQAAEGIAVTTYNSATLVTLGGCDPQYRSYQYTFSNDDLSSACTLNETNGEAIPNSNLWLSSGTYSCGSAGIMRAATMWLGISGGMLMAAFLAKGVRGALIYGILFVTFISWIPTSSNQAAYLGEDSTIPGGQDRLDYFKKVAVVPSTDQVAGKLNFSGFGNGDLWLALLTFLYVDFLDATGTLFSMATFMATTIPNFVDEKTKRFERQTITMCVDGFSTVIGSLFGLSPITIYVESAAGIKEGARTGIAALVISLW